MRASPSLRAKRSNPVLVFAGLPRRFAPRNDDIPYLVIASEARQSSYFFFGLCDDDCLSWIGACSYQK